jgi:hypothetical protein
MDASFSYQVRVAACDRCGAPSEAALTVGGFTCRFCNSSNQLSVRDEALVSPARPPITEEERIARLRMQDGRPLLPPSSVQHLFVAGQLPEWKVEEGTAIWNGSRKTLRGAPMDHETAERLVFLTIVLSQHFHRKGDRLRQRSMLEGALDVVALPRHRQIMRGMLARAAARGGDVAAAEAWLSPCDPRSDDLQMDSAWRFSRAFIDTAQGNFPRVLEVLGHGPDDVPIEDTYDDIVALFRANAWEKLGRTDQAVPLLRARLAAGGGTGRRTVERVVQLFADWNLCRESYAQAISGHTSAAARVAAKRASGGVHRVLTPIGALVFVVGVVGIAAVGLGIVGLIRMDGEAYAGIGLASLAFVLMGVVFFGMGVSMKESADKAAWLRVHGLVATAQVQSLARTGLEINGVPQVRFTLLVVVPGRAPYQAQAKALLGGGLSSLREGSNVPVRVHPQEPREVLIETD